MMSRRDIDRTTQTGTDGTMRTTEQQIRDYCEEHGNLRAMPFDRIQHTGTIAELHRELLSLAKARKIRLVIWSGARSDVPNLDYLLTIGNEFYTEDKYYAEIL